MIEIRTSRTWAHYPKLEIELPKIPTKPEAELRTSRTELFGSVYFGSLLHISLPDRE